MTRHPGCFQWPAGKHLAASVAAQPASGPASYDEIDTFVAKHMHRLNIPGVALAIVDGDQLVHLRGFGRARPHGEAPTPETPFFIGSLTKSVTALAVMQLVEAGKLELDAPVQHYLPWFRVADQHASTQITVRHLLTQTSGLPTSAGELALVNFDTHPGATERQARALSSLVLARPVGSAFEYSNANYSLLGLIIEAASGEVYAGYVQNHILAPLEMRHTYTSPAMAKHNGLAVGHQYWFAAPRAAPDLPVPLGSLPAGLLISSTEDLAHYLIALLNGGRYGNVQILSSTGIDELQRGVADVSAMGRSLGQYGMGWFVSAIGQTKLVWHGGTLPHFGAYLALLPEHKQGVILLFNACHHWMTPVLAELGTGVAALLAHEQPTRLPFVGLIPWALRGQLLIPALQIGGVTATLRLLRRWRLHPACRPSDARTRRLHMLLPLIPDLVVARTLLALLGRRRGYLRNYMPDIWLIALVCGSFSLLWSAMRPALILWALRAARRPEPALGGSARSAEASDHIP